MNVEDQMQQGSCQGNARTSAEETAIYGRLKAKSFSSVASLLTSPARKKNNLVGRDVGSTIEGGGRASKRRGSCLESLAPYTGRYYTKFEKAAYDDALTRTLTSYVVLENYQQVLQWLVHGVGGIVIGIGWNGTMEPDGQGKVESYRSGGGGHALALLDWNKRFLDAAGNPYIDMFNSWSKRWGMQGRAFIKPSVVDYWCRNETVIGYSKMNLADIKRSLTTG